MNIVNFLNEIYNCDYVYVYGAGEYGKTLAAYFLHLGILEKVSSFVITSGKGDRVFGKPVRLWRDIKEEINKNSCIVLAVSEEKQKDILKNISGESIENILKMSEEDYRYFRRYLKIDFEPEIFSHADEWNFSRVLNESRWLKRKDFAPGGWAVSSKYLYVLYHILNSGKFKSILDMGLGQTSKMIGQYADYDESVTHLIVEADREWIEFFHTAHGKTRSELEIMDYEIGRYQGAEVRIFSGFEKKLKGKRFDCISIDAPLGSQGEFSRVDIVDLLPDCLAESWVIMLDDVERRGERNTLGLIRDVLNKSGMPFAEKIYGGGSSFAVIASPHNRFFCSM